MLYWAVICFLIAILAGAFGFLGVASASAGVAQLLFYVFLGFFLVAYVVHLLER
ncbi:DUF1328 domain-containing protein [Pseudohalocynthiibacter aestuariivivens]|uniref:UPF0391 membrane protein N7U68_05515 n=1 Tax=Roseovarius pelagicus TaxID=2980108 RepID=A0ABY6DK15_9RHOB|nr:MULTISPECIES: DUF1328 domain-containing protein [Rhodobacterales]QIE47329.1 DUF1328 domain-containing protein [Pseudohalocynthiibacter aestuariivivens]UXX84110.1 DUF1328 domain-containing protein [Roseovarius pelagicus]